MKIFGVAAAILLASGCAMTPERFSKDRLSMSDTQVCRAERDAVASRNADFMQTTGAELERRSVGQSCNKLIQDEDTRNAVAALAVVAIVAVAAAAANNNGGGYSSAPSSTSTYSASSDYDWAWDQFYDASYQLVWACRGIQTGRFAELNRCQFDPHVDARWPGK